MDGQNKLTAYTIPAHHTRHTNLLKSKQFSLALKECDDGAVTMWLFKLFKTLIRRLAKLKVRELTRLNCSQIKCVRINPLTRTIVIWVQL